MNIYIIQHLPVLNNNLGLVTGLTDQPVCETGECLKNLIKSITPNKYKAVLSSPLIRSIQTIELCFRKDDIEIVIDARFLPVDYGEMHEKKKTDIAKLSPFYVKRQFPGGESFNDMANRYYEALIKAGKIYEGKDVLLVGHEGSEVILRHLCHGASIQDELRRSASARLEELETEVEPNRAFGNPPKGPYNFKWR